MPDGNMLDQMYNDFVTKALPMIQEGLIITKDYFIDLFGRYVTYLLITDIIGAVVSIIFMIGFIFLFRKGYKTFRTGVNMTDDHDEAEARTGIGASGMFVGALFGIISFYTAWDFVEDAVKAKFVPEVRVWEEIDEIRKMQPQTNKE